MLAISRVHLLIARLQERFGQRALGFAGALVIEALLILLLLTLGQGVTAPGGLDPGIATFDVTSQEVDNQAEESAKESAKESRPDDSQAAPRPVQEPVRPPPAATPAPNRPERIALIPLSRAEMQSADLAQRQAPSPQSSAEPAYGPAYTAPSDDSEVVGSAPNGEPLYAARWYREPMEGELSGYFSTASGPGWALIACRTAPGWRVEDCVGLGEHPQGSNIERAVLAAAWQFQVRPPKRGGRSLVGSWVRIRISLTDN